MREGCGNFVNSDKEQFTNQICGNLNFDQVLPVLHPHIPFPVAQIFPLPVGNQKKDCPTPEVFMHVLLVQFNS